MLIVNPAFGQATGGGERRALDTVDWFFQSHIKAGGE